MNTIVILAEPRVGSTWLVSIFAAHGYGVPRAGNGEGELLNFNATPIPKWATLQDAIEWVHNEMECARVAGRAVVKICYDQIGSIAGSFDRRLSEAQLLRAMFPGGLFVRLKRIDYVAQIVSLFIARQTGYFSSLDRNREVRTPEYDFTKLCHYWKTIRPDAAKILDPCCDLLRPIVIVYEDMLRYPEKVSATLSHALGELVVINADTPIKQEQSAVKNKYTERFRLDLEAWLSASAHGSTKDTRRPTVLIDTVARAHNTVHCNGPLRIGDEPNIEIRRYKEPHNFTFTPRSHIQLGIQLDLIDFASASRVATTNFYYFKNEAVLLEYALTKFALDTLSGEGFKLISTPDLAKVSIIRGIGLNSKDIVDECYRVKNTDLCLIGTSEATLAGLLSDSVIDESELPVKLAGVSHCYRREPTSCTESIEGLYRVHQFTKVEMFACVEPKASSQMHLTIRTIQEKLFELLDIPFRTVEVCPGNLGRADSRKYDLEAWMPCRSSASGSLGDWGEITSASNCAAFQSRRLNIKYGPNGTTAFDYVHTLNGTALAVPRVIIAILENNQQEDGSVSIPLVLRDYMGMDLISSV